jgi:eukaryotic-like serine/threonine-protein kinase
VEQVAESLTQVLARERLGSTLSGKWHLDRLLGVGGSASVYAATHRNGRRAAIKVLHAQLASVPAARKRFLREGYLANLVDHPGVVFVLDDDLTADGAPYLVMEVLEGETVEERRVRKGAMLSEGEVLSIVDQLLDVLAAAHERGIVHRDIKPANLFLTRQGCVKLLDFGLARSEEGGSQLTLHGSAMGTPAFLPPEQALGRSRVGARTDLWAVGATMLTLLSGRHVHRAANVNDALLAAMTRAAPPAREIVPELTPEIAEVIDRALRFDVEARWADARSMQAGVRAAYQAWLCRRLAMTPAPRVRRPASAMQIAAAGLLLAIPILLAVVISLVWLKLNRSAPPEAVYLGRAPARLEQ